MILKNIFSHFFLNVASFWTSILFLKRQTNKKYLKIHSVKIALWKEKKKSSVPVVTRASPPVGWHKTMLHPTHRTTVWAWLNTVVIFTQPFRMTHYKYILFQVWSKLLFDTWLFKIALDKRSLDLRSGQTRRILFTSVKSNKQFFCFTWAFNVHEERVRALH